MYLISLNLLAMLSVLPIIPYPKFIPIILPKSSLIIPILFFKILMRRPIVIAIVADKFVQIRLILSETLLNSS